MSGENPKTRLRRYWGFETLIPLTLLAVSFSVFILLWNSGQRARHERIELETRVTAEQVRLRLETWIDARASAVDLLAARWNHDYSHDPEHFRETATDLLAAYPGFQAVNWIDANWVIRIVVPLDSNRPALNQDLHGHSSRGVVTALHTAGLTGHMARTPVVELIQGGRGFTVYKPVRNDEGILVGYVNGVFRLDTLVDACLAEPYLRNHFSFNLVDENGQTAYEHGAISPEAEFAYRVESRVRVVNQPWTMRFAPSAALLEEASAVAGSLILLTGLILTIVLAVTLRTLMNRQRALRESESKYKLLVENQTDLIVRYCVDGRLKFVSPSVCRSFGIDERALLEGGYKASLHGEDRRIHDEAIEGVTPTNPTSYVEVRMQTLEGWRWLGWAFTGVMHQDGSLRALVGVGRDITERRRLQDHLLQSQKLQAVGRLAEGVAHDFNNIFQAILGHLELVASRLKDDEKASHSLTRMREATMRAAALTRQLLAFGRRQDLQPIDVDLDRIVTDMLKLVRSTIGDGIVLDHQPHGLLDTIRADTGQIEQIVVNLCQNAVEAMPDGGRLSLRTFMVEADSPLAPGPERGGHGRWVALEVLDTGTGMDPDTQSRIFEPFFSTKRLGRGTGLGLATAHGIVEQHGGSIGVESHPGRGTLFRVLFPSSETLGKTGEERHNLPRKGDRLLIIRDTPGRTAMADGSLRAAGYDLIVARTIEDARDMISDGAQDFRLVILDMDPSGSSLAGHQNTLAGIAPDLPVLCIMDSASPAAEDTMIDEECVETLSAPFTSGSLLYRIHQLLDSGGQKRLAS